MSSLGTGLRALQTLATLAGLSAGCWWLFADDRASLVHSPGQASFSVLVAGLAAVALQAALGWLSLLTALVLLEPWTGRELAAYLGCPRTLRHVVLGVCGVAAVSVLVAPADAAPAPSVAPVSGSFRVGPGDQGRSGTVDGLPLPERPTGAVTHRVPPPSTRPVTERFTVVVHDGDTLWDIAARRLPAGAGPGAIDRGWRAIYAANRALIGPDPSLIRPGIRLRIPPAHQEETHEHHSAPALRIPRHR